MKKNLLLLMLFLAGTSMSFAQIQFEKFDWNKLTQKAANEHKLIMVDMTATWCGWCKFMDKNIFSERKVGTYFNKEFISVKLYDTHPMGSKFSSKYDVEGFPTFLFLDSRGKLVHKISGAIQDVNAFIAEGKTARRKGSYVYNGGGNVNGGSEEQQDDNLKDAARKVQELAEMDEGELNFEDDYEAFLKRPNAKGSIDEMELTYELVGYGSYKAAEQIHQRYNSFENYVGKQEIIEALLSGAMAATILEAGEKLDPEQASFAEDLEQMANPIFRRFIRDHSLAKAGTHLGIAAIFAELEMMEESIDQMIAFAPDAGTILTETTDLIEFYTFLAGMIYDEDRTADYKKAIEYGELAVELGGTGEIYEILSFIYDELEDEVNAKKYENLIED